MPLRALLNNESRYAWTLTKADKHLPLFVKLEEEEIV